MLVLKGLVGLHRAIQLQLIQGGGEEIPLVQGKEQWLSFAGSDVKRYTTPKLRETHVRR